MNNFARHILLLGILTFSLNASSALADDPYDFDAVSPKEGWGELEVVEEESEPLPFYVEVLLWPVNRFLDLIDIVRIDAGVGTSYGGVVRLTRSGSLGYRHVSPGAVRVGSFGRKPPFLIEEENEYGAGKQYQFSADREVCDAEFGLGLDAFIGGYIGVCMDNTLDFLAGIVFLDPDDDDIR